MGQNNSNPLPPSTAETRANYDRLSRWYDLLSGIEEKKYKDAGLAMLRAKPGEYVLEIGFGTGQCLIPLAEAVGENGRVDGIDLSDGMRQVAQKKIGKTAFQERIHLLSGDARELPYAENSFDAVYISFTLELFKEAEIPMVLQQIHHGLKPDGRLCVVAMGKREHTNLIMRLYSWAHTRYPHAVDCRLISTAPLLADNGFVVVTVRQMSLFGLPVDVVLATG
ncbi:MAG: methyltransferase domain-containing protein [Anaerolineae bacterium]|jgi:demethylmenaquinone methyltransferase/2-methoxy-6-polyprenyl-1,4-benzoquinol methylase|nr:methyltransferase domain-containing protein [Anaerolineae bacterium]